MSKKTLGSIPTIKIAVILFVLLFSNQSFAQWVSPPAYVVVIGSSDMGHYYFVTRTQVEACLNYWNKEAVATFSGQIVTDASGTWCGSVGGGYYAYVRPVVCDPGTYPSYGLNSDNYFQSFCSNSPFLNPKNNGPTCPSTAYPIAIGSGNKYLEEKIYNSGSSPLRLSIFYNSADKASATSWSTNPLDRSVLLEDTKVTVSRGTGKAYVFYKYGSQTSWAPNPDSDPDVNDKLIQNINGSGVTVGWSYRTTNKEVEQYDANGKLLSITDGNNLVQTVAYSDGTSGSNGGFILDGNGNPTATALPANLPIRLSDAFGHVLRFGYDSSNRIIKVTDPDNKVYLIGYDTSNNLVSLTYPGNAIKRFIYNELANTSGADLPHALTGIIDENNKRYITYQYDSAGRAISEKLAGNVNNSSLDNTYSNDSDPRVTVTNALGKKTTYHFKDVLNPDKVVWVEGVASANCVSSNAHYLYDTKGNVSAFIDGEGNLTQFTYDANGLELTRTEGQKLTGAVPAAVLTTIPPFTNTPATRTISTTWNVNLRVPLTVTYPDKVITYTYNSAGQQLTKKEHPTQ